MKSFLLAELSRRIWIAVALVVLTACASQSEKAPHSASACPSTYSFGYADSVHGFGLCLPANVKRGDATDYPAGSVVFTGFAVPAKTDLVAKQLLIVPGNYEMMQAASAFGHLTADGVTFARRKAEEGSAGHITVHVIYTWKKGNQEVHFDFAHRSVNVANFAPSNRPAEYNRGAQIKITEEVMSTFRTLR